MFLFSYINSPKSTVHIIARKYPIKGQQRYIIPYKIKIPNYQLLL